LLADLGVPQAVLPPHERPSICALRALGFGGCDEAAILRAAARAAPELLAACGSASAMWVANAATVTPAVDTADGRVHFTPANLLSKFHRAIETAQTTRTLRAVFHDAARFVVHDPLPGGLAFADEGAANHSRFAPQHGRRGLHLFVYGQRAFGGARAPVRFPSRQSLEASRAVCRYHQLAATAVVCAQQNPLAVDAGVFHNDVISVGNENVFIYHEHAFVNTPAVIRELRHRYAALHRGSELIAIKVPAARMSLATAVKSYIFNSQLVSLARGGMALIAPTQCAEMPAVSSFTARLLDDPRAGLTEVRHVDLRQSMSNGGGPACLRLRVVLGAAECAALPPRMFLTGSTHAALTAWVATHYRERLTAADLADPKLLDESRAALDELTGILGLGSIYPFQGAPCSGGL